MNHSIQKLLFGSMFSYLQCYWLTFAINLKLTSARNYFYFFLQTERFKYLTTIFHFALKSCFVLDVFSILLYVVLYMVWCSFGILIKISQDKKLSQLFEPRVKYWQKLLKLLGTWELVTHLLLKEKTKTLKLLNGWFKNFIWFSS